MRQSIIGTVLALCAASLGASAHDSELAAAQPAQGGPRHCRYIPGDNGWPEVDSWKALNKTVGGRLIKTRPIGEICHYPNYNERECSALARDWGLVTTDVPLPAEFLSLYFQNNTCTPFTPPGTRCRLGNYVSYSIDVRSIEDVRAGLNFVKKHNIRLVIHNSGHDFNGQSTGKGALALWMHNYNKVEVVHSYSSTYYNGPALKVQTGAEGAVAVAHASSHGYTVVSGACPTVKMAGGYLAGGGHGYLAGMYGFGADNVLEWEIVTASGKRLVATPEKHVDLYWALSGGGGGTFGVVLSATVRAFQNSVTSNAAFSFSAEQAGGDAQYWDAVDTFHEQITPLLDEGIVVEYGFTKDVLAVVGIMASGKNSTELQSTLQPLVAALTSRPSSKLSEDSLSIRLTQADNYYDLYKTEIPPVLEPLVLGPAIAGRFVPRAAVDSGSPALGQAYRTIAERGYAFSVIALNALNPVRNRTAPPIAPNAVQPNFINAYSSLMINASWSHSRPWSEAQAVQDTLMNEIIPIFDAAVPGAGAYKNEANWAEKDLKQSFFGGTYARLEKIKAEIDPEGLFYGIVSVGFDKYEADSDGRLCRIVVEKGLVV